jgi:hypothetical protein
MGFGAACAHGPASQKVYFIASFSSEKEVLPFFP